MTQGDPIPPPPSDPMPGGSMPPAGSPGYVPPAPGAPVGGGLPVGYESMAGPVETNPEAKTWGMLAHLSSLAGFVVPFGNLIGPLIVWQMKKQYPFVEDQGKESMNFQITVTIALLVALLTICIGIGIFLAPAVGIAAAVMSVIAGIKANEGVAYRYPFTLRLIK